jgi:hypothetical protein
MHVIMLGMMEDRGQRRKGMDRGGRGWTEEEGQGESRKYK